MALERALRTVRKPAQALAAARVLAVDDAPIIRELVSDILQEAGATVITATSALRALDLVVEWRPDVVVSDLEMPRYDGYWLIARIRALPPEKGGRTPAACLTGLGEPEDRERALRAGFQHHVAKPVEVACLVDILARLLDRP